MTQAMFRLSDPATWPQEGDQLWIPSDSPISFTVAGCHVGSGGHPMVKFVDGYVDRLSCWGYYPRLSDRVIIAAGPLYDLYPEHWVREWCDRVLWEDFQVSGPGLRPSRGVAASCPRPFFQLTPVNGGKPISLPDICLVVVGTRHE